MSDFNESILIRGAINNCYRYLHKTDKGAIYIVGKRFTETYVSPTVNINRYVYKNNIDKKDLRLVESNSDLVHIIINKMRTIAPLKSWIKVHPNECTL